MNRARAKIKICVALTLVLSVSISGCGTGAKEAVSFPEASVYSSFDDIEPVSAPDSAASPTETEETEDAENAEIGLLSEADEIVGEIITYYGTYGIDSEEKIQTLFTRLAEIDSARAELWCEIMEYWKNVDSGVRINRRRLPDGLPNDESLCIVVLGYKLNEDGTMKDELVERLKVALSCSKQYPNAFVMCTGGGTAEDDADISEAEAMARWLIKNGLDAEKIIIENESLSTVENARLSTAILLSDYPEISSLAIVTSSYHIPRAYLLFGTWLIKSASEGRHELYIVSNAVYQIENQLYGNDTMSEAEVMLQLFGYYELASDYGRGLYVPPELEEKAS